MALPENQRSLDYLDGEIFRYCFADQHKLQPDKRRRHDVPAPSSDAEIMLAALYGD